MSDVVYVFAATAGIAALLATLAIWAPRRLPVRMAAIGLTALLLPAAYLGFTTLLSQPKPITMEWLDKGAGDATVLGSVIREGEGIYLWIQPEGDDIPRYYVLPWDLKQAQQLQNAMRDADKNQNGLKMRAPYEPTWDRREPRFYAAPQPAPPPKRGPEEEDDGPMIYRHPGWDV
jgi:hypothetical protein